MPYADRTTLNNVTPNLDIGDVADPALRLAFFQYVINLIDANYAEQQTLVTSGTLSPIPPDFMQRQAIINGNFDVWQRGTSFGSVALAYTADRWKGNFSADGGTLPTITQNRLSLSGGEVDGSAFAYWIQTNGVGTSLGANSYAILEQLIENGTRKLCGANKKVTLSFWARSDISGKRIGVYAGQTYGTGGLPSAGETINGNVFTLTSTWTKYTYTFTTNTLSGKTFGTDNNDSLNIAFTYMWGVDRASRVGTSTAETFVGAGNIYIAQVQLCAGDAALPFQPRTFAEELALCQRYYEKSYQLSDAPGAAVVAGTFGNQSVIANPVFTIPFKTRKRAVPTVTFYSYVTGASGKVRDFGASADLTVTVGNNGESQCTVNVTGTIAGNLIIGHWTAEAEL